MQVLVDLTEKNPSKAVLLAFEKGADLHGLDQEKDIISIEVNTFFNTNPKGDEPVVSFIDNKK